MCFCDQILEALTTLRCHDDFSMERLELLGDSVLKYTVSCHLFLKYPKKHEGQLTSCRTLAICNSNLHRLGINRKLQVFPLYYMLSMLICIHSGTDVQAHVIMALHFFNRDTSVIVRLTHVVGFLQGRFLYDPFLVLVEWRL